MVHGAAERRHSSLSAEPFIMITDAQGVAVEFANKAEIEAEILVKSGSALW